MKVKNNFRTLRLAQMTGTIAVFGLIAWAGQAQAQTSGGAGNGGDTVRAGFILEGKGILKDVFSAPQNQGTIVDAKITQENLAKNLNTDVIKVTNDTLTDNTNSVVDALAAPGSIFLNRANWFEIMRVGHDSKNINYRVVIFHELLRSVGVNDDNYLVSGPIMARVHPSYPDVLPLNSEWKWARQRFADGLQPRTIGRNPILLAYSGVLDEYRGLVVPTLNDMKCSAYLADGKQSFTTTYSLRNNELFSLEGLKFWFSNVKAKFDTSFFYDRTIKLSSTTVTFNGKRYFIFARGVENYTGMMYGSNVYGPITFTFEVVTDDEAASENERSIELPTLRALGYIECTGSYSTRWRTPRN